MKNFMDCPELTKEEKLDIIHSIGADTEHVLAILLELQDKSKYSYIDEDTAKLVAGEVGISLTRMYDILTFYAMLETKPRGKYVLEVCKSTPCHYTKSDEIVGIVEGLLQIKMGETTGDGLFTLSYTPCVGACDIGPVIKVRDEVYGNLNADKIKTLITQLKAAG